MRLKLHIIMLLGYSILRLHVIIIGKVLAFLHALSDGGD